MSKLSIRLDKIEPAARALVWTTFRTVQLGPLLERYLTDDVLEALACWEITDEQFTELLYAISPEAVELIEWLNEWMGDPEEEAWKRTHWPTTMLPAPIKVTEEFMDALAPDPDTDEGLTAATVLYAACWARALQQFKAHAKKTRQQT